MNAAMPFRDPATPAVPLILDERFLGMGYRGDPPKPGRALVFSTDDGQAVELPRRPSIAKASFQYVYRYEVDITDQFTPLHVELPSREEAFRFQVDMEVGWRVSDPSRVVEKRIADGLAVVRSRLVDLLRPLGRRFDVEQCAHAEAAINERHGDREEVLPEGITVFRLSAHVRLDDATAGWLSERRDLIRQGDLDTTRHRNDVRTAQQHHELARMGQRGEAELDRERMDAVRAAVNGKHGLLALLLAQDRGQIGAVIEALTRGQQTTNETTNALFRTLVEQNLIQEADIDPMRQALLSQIQPFQAPTGAAGQVLGLAQVDGTRPDDNGPAAGTPRPEPINGTAVTNPAGPPPPPATAPSDGVVSWAPVRRKAPDADDDARS